MNRKQFTTMWGGIIAIVLAGFAVIQNYGLVSFYGFSVWALMVAVTTSGLIYSFKEDHRKPQNTIQDIRDNILKRKQFKIRKNNHN